MDTKMNAFVWWEAFRGYFFMAHNYNEHHRYHLDGGVIYLYKPDGTTYKVNLEYGCNFEFKALDLKFSERKMKDGVIPPVCFTRNEIFAVRIAKKNNFDEKNNAAVFIPASAVNLVVSEPYEEDGEYHISTYRKLTFEIGPRFQTWQDQSHPTMIVTDEDGKTLLSVSEFVKMRCTEEFTKRQKLAEQIKKTCGVEIGDYDLKCLLKHYKLTKKRNVKNEAE